MYRKKDQVVKIMDFNIAKNFMAKLDSPDKKGGVIEIKGPQKAKMFTDTGTKMFSAPE